MRYDATVSPGIRSSATGEDQMYNILYIIGAIVVIIVVLRVLGLF